MKLKLYKTKQQYICKFSFKNKQTKPSLFSLPLTDRKAALEAVVKSLGPGFVAEFNKHKSLRAPGQGSSGSGKSPHSHGPLGKMPGNMKKPLKTSVSPKASKKDVPSLPGSSSSSPETDDLPQSKEMEEDEEDLSTGTSGPCPTPYNRVSFLMFFSVISRIWLVSHFRGIACGKINHSVC